jgi:hypothetical protein
MKARKKQNAMIPQELQAILEADNFDSFEIVIIAS